MILGRSVLALAFGALMIVEAPAQFGGMPPQENLPPISNVAPNSVPPMPTTLPSQGNAPPMSTMQQGEKPPCLDEFVALRNEAQARASVLQNAQKKKLTAPEACQLITRFTDAETKFVKFAQKNAATCGIPEQAITQMNGSHEKSMELRKKVCDAAAAPQRPAGPSLSDALGTTRLPDTSSVKKGTGTFDTLTGTTLAR
jgi:hypothetical protein